MVGAGKRGPRLCAGAPSAGITIAADVTVPFSIGNWASAPQSPAATGEDFCAPALDQTPEGQHTGGGPTW